MNCVNLLSSYTTNYSTKLINFCYEFDYYYYYYLICYEFI